MDKELISELISIIDNSSITEFEYSKNDTSIKIKKEVKFVTPVSESMLITRDATEIAQVSQTKELAEKTGVEEDYKVIKSPIVGTFYNSSSPDKPAFVNVGDKISKGQTVCIVEAMKIMNEITSEFEGEIVEILCENEQMVEYDMPLFKVK